MQRPWEAEALGLSLGGMVQAVEYSLYPATPSPLHGKRGVRVSGEWKREAAALYPAGVVVPKWAERLLPSLRGMLKGPLHRHYTRQRTSRDVECLR